MLNLRIPFVNKILFRQMTILKRCWGKFSNLNRENVLNCKLNPPYLQGMHSINRIDLPLFQHYPFLNMLIVKVFSAFKRISSEL
jgi:hypothetical protein